MVAGTALGPATDRDIGLASRIRSRPWLIDSADDEQAVINVARGPRADSTEPPDRSRPPAGERSAAPG